MDPTKELQTLSHAIHELRDRRVQRIKSVCRDVSLSFRWNEVEAQQQRPLYTGLRDDVLRRTDRAIVSCGERDRMEVRKRVRLTKLQYSGRIRYNEGYDGGLEETTDTQGTVRECWGRSKPE
ncbi:hypothetical protein PHBOTO_006053 [Pseudozyma hubeiensis]|nr:hypothetical protein PHBOTO_006053 [Pseudozyma hubeiensis]